MSVKNYRTVTCTATAVASLGAALFCSSKTYSYYQQIDEQTEVFVEIAEVVENVEPEEEPPRDKDIPASEGRDILAEYKELYLQNEDMVDWIVINGTSINYPVMQSRNNPNFYLKHNFEKECSDLGVPYIQEDCNLITSDDLAIYGYHTKGGRMFGVLEDYKSESFYEKYKIIQFDTLTEQGKYEIIAILRTVAYNSRGYRYCDFIDVKGEKEFDTCIGRRKESVLCNTGVTAEYGDRLATPSTREYFTQDSGFVVVAKKMN